VTPESLMTQGLISGQGGAGGPAPDPSCITVHSVGPDWVKIQVIPPVNPANYNSTMILYAAVNGCTYVEAGPEDAQDIVTITGLTEGTIYAFVPVGRSAVGSKADPGNVVFATVPVNLIDMENLELNSCGLEDVWTMIRSKATLRELATSLRAFDLQLLSITGDRHELDKRLIRLEVQIAAILKEIE